MATRPILDDITSGLAAWDGPVDDNFKRIMNGPFPIYRVANVGSLPSASTHEDCFAWVISPGALYKSNGSAWVLYGSTAGTTALTDNSWGTPSNTLAFIDQTITGVDGTGNNAADVAEVNTVLGDLADAVASLSAKVNEILTATG